jgi:hypothetical protein
VEEDLQTPKLTYQEVTEEPILVEAVEAVVTIVPTIMAALVVLE